MEEKIMMPREEYIEFLANQSGEISISNHNSKTGSCCNNLAFPTCTCRDDAPCKASGCYCMKGTQAMCKVVAAYLRNLKIYNNDPEDFWEQVRFKIKHNPLPLFRWFDAGDILDYDFFRGMVELANEFPNIRFMSFTKKYNIVNEWLVQYGDLPNNLNIIFSAWHIGWKVNNPFDMPVAYVDFKDQTLNPQFPKGITGCPNQSDKTITCSMCQKCWNKKVKAVVFKQH
jgi:hypothetical protein